MYYDKTPPMPNSPVDSLPPEMPIITTQRIMNKYRPLMNAKWYEPGCDGNECNERIDEIMRKYTDPNYGCANKKVPVDSMLLTNR